MGRGRLSKEEIEELKQNIYVNDADEKRIFYTNEFKARFMEEYLKGKRPTRIFKDAGFNVEALGEKRIERAAARWRELYAAGGIEAFSGEAMRELKNKYHDQTNGFTCEIDSVGVLTATDLFGAPFKELMPGDEVTREISIKNSYTGCKSVTIYIKAIAHDDEKNKPIANTPSVKKKLDDVPSMQRFLSCFDMTITDTKSGKELFNGTAEKLTLPGEYVSLGSFPKNEGTTLKVWLYANPERLTNEFANCAGEIDWQLLVEEYEEPGPDPTKPGPNPRPVPTPTPTTAPQGEPEGIQPARGPKTGDYSNVFLYGGLLLVSAGAAAGVIIAGKKKKEDE